MTAEKLYNGIYCMDCMELLAQIPDGYVSMILTVPPYGISYRNNFTKRKHRVLAGDEGIDYERFARESYRILKEDSHARRGGVRSTIPRCWRTGKKRALSAAREGSPERSIRQGSMPAGSGRNTQRRLTIPSGRNSMVSTILP